MSSVPQHQRAHRTVVRVTAALVTSVAVEVVALNAGITDNILWPPTTFRRGLMLVALLVPWVPVMQDVVERVGRRRQSLATVLRGPLSSSIGISGGVAGGIWRSKWRPLGDQEGDAVAEKAR
jgi:hypothetical protein